MRNFLIGCMAILAVAVTALAETKERPKELSVDLGRGVKLEMVLIPAGSFLMGDAKGDDDAKPVHKVDITKPFYLGKYEVTQEQWYAVMGTTPGYIKEVKYPVEQVTWKHCQQFLDKLNAQQDDQPGNEPGEKPGKKPGIFQLPTEAQWEYACRAGSTTGYCFGDDEARLGDHAWYNANPGYRTRAVGKKKPNAWGLYDMHGNVQEWCADWYDAGYYAKSPVDDPTGPATGASRVRRGGSVYDPAKGCRSATRNYLLPGELDLDVGLRVALIPAE